MLPCLRAPVPLLKGNKCEEEVGGRGGERPQSPLSSPLPSPLQPSDRSSGAALTLALAGQSWPAQVEVKHLPKGSPGSPTVTFCTDTHLAPGRDLPIRLPFRQQWQPRVTPSHRDQEPSDPRQSVTLHPRALFNTPPPPRAGPLVIEPWRVRQGAPAGGSLIWVCMPAPPLT